MKNSVVSLNSIDAHRAIVIYNRTNNQFATGLLTASIHNLKNELEKRIVRICYMKKDGNITTRYATTLPQMTKNHINGRGISGDERNVVVYYDLEASTENKWRSFRYENLISFE